MVDALRYTISLCIAGNLLLRKPCITQGPR